RGGGDGGRWDGEGGERRPQDDGRQPASHPAARSRATVASRPSNASDSGSGGETLDPVTAARTGSNALLRFNPSPLPTASSVAMIASCSHGSRASSASATFARYPGGAFSIVALAFSSGTTSSVNRNR